MKSINIHIAVLTVSLLSLLFSGCDKGNDHPDLVPPPVLAQVKKIAEHNMDVVEASGLSFGKDKQTLLTVSDNSNRIYEMDLEGRLLRTLNYTGNDLEGIAYNPDSNQIAVVEERQKMLVILDYETGNLIKQFDIEVPTVEENKGLEGISWNGNNQCYYMVNEAKPSEMLIWKENWGIISRYDLDLGSDNSGIFVESDNARLWIASDESNAVYLCDYNANKLLKLDFNVPKIEGIVYDNAKQRLYLVSDKIPKLYTYQVIIKKKQF